MLSWLRCFPHDGTVMDDESSRKPRPGRSATFRKKHYPNAAKRFIRTGTSVTASSSAALATATLGRHSDYNHSIVSARSFTFRELAAATASFSHANLIGEGGFGRVYRGLIGSSPVAVKQLDRTGFQGDHEFLVEVLVLSSLLTHPNLVGLLGYCADGNQRLLVYQLMPLGSLENHLFLSAPAQAQAPAPAPVPADGDAPAPAPAVLSWQTRMRIAHGAAQGLEFLHETANPPVIYRDLKSSNILLDEGYNAKLSDFGLAKLAEPTTRSGNGGEEEEKHSSSRVMGTYGYCAPEYIRTGHLTVKSDVYSFGVVLLELITGKRVVDDSRPAGEQNLVAWAAPMFSEQRRMQELVDPLLVARGEGPSGRELKQAVAVAAMCLQEEDSVRPIMSDVVMALSFLAADPLLSDDTSL